MLESPEKSPVPDGGAEKEDAPAIDHVQKPATVSEDARPSEPAGDAVEIALAAALEGATKAGEWGVVARLAEELQARRVARASNVVSIARKVRK